MHRRVEKTARKTQEQIGIGGGRLSVRIGIAGRALREPGRLVFGGERAGNGAGKQTDGRPALRAATSEDSGEGDFGVGLSGRRAFSLQGERLPVVRRMPDYPFECCRERRSPAWGQGAGFEGRNRELPTA